MPVSLLLLDELINRLGSDEPSTKTNLITHNECLTFNQALIKTVRQELQKLPFDVHRLNHRTNITDSSILYY